jgi:hypothetical protein
VIDEGSTIRPPWESPGRGISMNEIIKSFAVDLLGCGVAGVS